MRSGKRNRRERRRSRVRAKLKGTAQRPRLSVCRSHRHLWAQLIDDFSGRTLASASDLELPPSRGRRKSLNRQERAAEVGSLLAKKARAKGISLARFDRGRYHYHGALKALADGARAGGLEF